MRASRIPKCARAKCTGGHWSILFAQPAAAAGSRAAAEGQERGLGTGTSDPQRRPEKLPRDEQDGCPSRARIQSGPSHAAKGGVLPPPTIMAIATALPGLLAATAAPEMTWLPLNVAVVDNDRGASPNSYRARALWGWCATGASSHLLDTCKVAAVAWDVKLSDSAGGGMTRC